MKFGYARVSTPQQNLDMQFDALSLFGIEESNIFYDVASGAKEDRKGLDTLLLKLRSEDTVVVWKSCRLARNVKHMLSMMEFFESNNIEFKSIQEPFLDTKSPHGRFIFNVFTSLNQMDREINRERVMIGLTAARKRGKTGGRPKGLSKRLKKLAPLVATMWKDDDNTIPVICKTLGIAPASIYKCLKHMKIDYSNYNHRNRNKRNKKYKEIN